MQREVRDVELIPGGKGPGSPLAEGCLPAARSALLGTALPAPAPEYRSG